MISINAQIKSYIDWIVHDINYIKEEYKKYLTKEIFCNNTHKKDYIKEMFDNCISFFICEETIIFTVNKDDNEVKEMIKDSKHHLKCMVNQVKKNFNDDKYHKMIESYLKHIKRNDILKMIS